MTREPESFGDTRFGPQSALFDGVTPIGSETVMKATCYDNIRYFAQRFKGQTARDQQRPKPTVRKYKRGSGVSGGGGGWGAGGRVRSNGVLATDTSLGSSFGSDRKLPDGNGVGR